MSVSSSNLVVEKRALRERMLALRRALTAEEVARRSRLAVLRLLELPAIRQAETIFCYLSHDNEVETLQLVRDWLAGGKHIHVPAFDAKQRRYHACPINDFDRDLVPGKLGILEPRNRTLTSRLADIAIVPGVAFDADGHRLGYGKGFYDDMLRYFTGLKIALSFDSQMQPVVPHEGTDVLMDAIVTESTIHWRKHL
ncbi:MAG: 5-formyltetrahydrofolate cyclo-ligase [Verrucomicrobia bacterium]|nr:5-formyltetrahydrofolate cyclo-ligase [Verrucomicrobiota bacterium]